jgi:4-hydroxybenzoate polyprenyltransferase
MVAFLTAVGWLAQLGWAYYVALLGVVAFFMFQTHQLRGPITPVQAFDMFRAHVWVGITLLIGLLGGVLI